MTSKFISGARETKARDQTLFNSGHANQVQSNDRGLHLSGWYWDDYTGKWEH